MKHSKVQLLLFLMLLAFSSSLRQRRRDYRRYARPGHPVFSHHRPRIVGGVEATPHSIPYQAAVYIGGQLCGGSLITKRYVLTAAHCANIYDPNNPIIYLGAHNVNIQQETGRQIIWGGRKIIHENYVASNFNNDIAIIYLQQEAKLNVYVKTIPIARRNAPDFAGSLLQTSGWGKTSDSSSNSPVLRYVQIYGITNAECKNYYHAQLVIAGVLCAGAVAGKGTCDGDSGGPLVDVASTTLVGVASFGDLSGCETRWPVGFTRVSYYADWIHSKIGLL